MVFDNYITGTPLFIFHGVCTDNDILQKKHDSI